MPYSSQARHQVVNVNWRTDRVFLMLGSSGNYARKSRFLVLGAAAAISALIGAILAFIGVDESNAMLGGLATLAICIVGFAVLQQHAARTVPTRLAPNGLQRRIGVVVVLGSIAVSFGLHIPLAVIAIAFVAVGVTVYELAYRVESRRKAPWVEDERRRARQRGNEIESVLREAEDSANR